MKIWAQVWWRFR